VSVYVFEVLNSIPPSYLGDRPDRKWQNAYRRTTFN